MSWPQLLSTLVATAVATTPNAIPPAEPVQPEHIALENERNDRVTVPVTIQGTGPYRFMVDTGAQATVVSSALADRLGLTERKQAMLVGLASTEAVETAEIPDFGLGSREFDIRVAPILPAENLGGADGILGLDSLQDQRVLIDFVQNKILVANAKALGGNRGYEIIVKARRKLGQLIITNARVNGIDTDVIIDTGSQGSVGNIALLDRLRQAAGLGRDTMTDVNGKELTAIVKVGREVRIDNITLTSIPILFAEAPPFKALGLDKAPALILGINELKLFRRVAIDFDKRQVLFDLPSNVRQNDDAMLTRVFS
jgi:predicted aspartyl protease